MPKFRYRGTDSRYYPSLGLAVEPGDSVDLPEMPEDGRWEAERAATKAAKPEPTTP